MNILLEAVRLDEVPVRTRAAGGDLAGAVDGSVELSLYVRSLDAPNKRPRVLSTG